MFCGVSVSAAVGTARAMSPGMNTTDTNGKTIDQAREYAQTTASKVGSARGDRVVTLGKLFHSKRRWSYGVRFELPGDLTEKVVDGLRIESVEQFYPQ